jgi:hypothetical protein
MSAEKRSYFSYLSSDFHAVFISIYPEKSRIMPTGYRIPDTYRIADIRPDIRLRRISGTALMKTINAKTDNQFILLTV